MTDRDMIDTAFLDAQHQAGAAAFHDGMAAPTAVDFGDPRIEYQAARNASAVFDVGDRTQIELTGRDRAKFLHNFCTNNVLDLQSGAGCEAFVTNVKGRVLAHVFVFATDESLWLDTVAGAAESLLTHLDRYLITEDVGLHDRTAEFAELLVTGPQAAAQLAALPLPVESLTPYAHTTVTLDGQPVSIRRIDLVGAPGYVLAIPRPHLVEIWNRLVEAQVQPGGRTAFDALRIEAGMPLYGIDITDDNLAQEVARTNLAISFKKGCYLGQEPIARIDALGHVNRELRGLRIEAPAPPAPGALVFAADGDQQIGQVTSSAVHPAESGRQSLALAYLRRGSLEPGTSVRVQIGEQAAPATVFWPVE
jgi:tRNA-modifying protein YgfZ